MHKLTTVLIALLPSYALAQQPKDSKPAPPPTPPAKDVKAPPPPAKPEAPKPPPEVAETVGMFKGNWTFDATITATGMPGMEKPFKGKMTMACKPVAGNSAVACDGKMKTPMGPFDGHFVIAYDPYGKQVHFFGATSMNEVHDHKCGQWNHGMAGKSALTCESLKGGMGPAGDEITEDVSFSFHKDGKELTFTSTSKMKAGATMTFEGTGKK